MPGLTLSQAEVLLRTFHGRCGHRRQTNLPCATPVCREGTEALELRSGSKVARRIMVPFGGEKHFVWKTAVEEAEYSCPSELSDGTTKSG